MIDQVRVLVEATGVELVVKRSYYERYKNQGIRFVSEVNLVKNSEPIKVAPEKSLEDMSYQELKDLCTIKEMTFKGNASKEELINLLKE